eukprot:7551483-Lingulodinium_polyedra.AAC.1
MPERAARWLPRRRLRRRRLRRAQPHLVRGSCAAAFFAVPSGMPARRRLAPPRAARRGPAAL